MLPPPLPGTGVLRSMALPVTLRPSRGRLYSGTSARLRTRPSSALPLAELPRVRPTARWSPLPAPPRGTARCDGCSGARARLPELLLPDEPTELEPDPALDEPDEEPVEPPPEDEPLPPPPRGAAEPVVDPVFGRDPAWPAQTGAMLSVKAAATNPIVNLWRVIEKLLETGRAMTLPAGPERHLLTCIHFTPFPGSAPVPFRVQRVPPG
jgi:hypothetical protein